jgi:predicted SprT family Zn-dependent metalloprotease
MDLQTAERLALTLMDEFGLLPAWQFRWDHAKKRFGRCNYQKKVISLSRHLTKINPQVHVEDTIRHEIAHAKDAEERGKSDHSRHWERWARKCGAKPDRCYSSADVNSVEAPLYTYCPNCETYSPRYRRIKNGRIYACGQCSRSFNPDYAIVPNIRLPEKKRLENGQLNWYELPQAAKIARHFEERRVNTLYLRRFRGKME